MQQIMQKQDRAIKDLKERNRTVEDQLSIADQIMVTVGKVLEDY